MSLGLAAVSSAALVHRYSFDTDVSDSVGSADGALLGTANVSGGALQLDGSNGAFAALDASTIGINTFAEVSFEGWWSHDSQTSWGRLFDFGATNGSNLGAEYIFYSPVGSPGGNASQYAAISDADPGFNNENSITLSGKLANGSYHMALTFNNATDTMTLYIDGVQVGQNTSATIDLSALSNDHAYLGEASYPGDSNLSGSIDEFRIYNTELSSSEIAASFAAGADSIPEPSSSAMLGLAGLALILRRKK